MDVEDPINPLADDAALDFGRLFSEAGVRGSFCITGEKCRALSLRGRTDVAAALAPHALGLHTDTHSFHPSTMEMLADLDWDAGCAAAFATESRGFEAFAALFGRPPVFWGGGGNTWSPEITDALKRIGIRAYVYALTQFPDFAVHEFNGVIAMPQALSIGEADWQDDARCSQACNRVLKSLDAIKQGWIGVFVGHPTKFRHVDWWDTPYYKGRTPNEPETSPPVPDDTYKRGKRNLRSFLDRIQREFAVIGADEALALPWSMRQPTPDERTSFESASADAIRAAKNWPIHYEGLNPEGIVRKTLALAETAKVAALPF